jgi:hypothetical protein
MTTITILVILTILAGVATLSVTGFSVINPVAAQTPTGDNATTSGNMTGGNVTGGNTTEAVGTISGDGDGGTVSTDGGGGGCLDC